MQYTTLGELTPTPEDTVLGVAQRKWQTIHQQNAILLDMVSQEEFQSQEQPSLGQTHIRSQILRLIEITDEIRSIFLYTKEDQSIDMAMEALFPFMDPLSSMKFSLEGVQDESVLQLIRHIDNVMMHLKEALHVFAQYATDKTEREKQVVEERRSQTIESEKAKFQHDLDFVTGYQTKG